MVSILSYLIANYGAAVAVAIMATFIRYLETKKLKGKYSVIIYNLLKDIREIQQDKRDKKE